MLHSYFGKRTMSSICAHWTVNEIPPLHAENEGPVSPSREESLQCPFTGGWDHGTTGSRGLPARDPASVELRCSFPGLKPASKDPVGYSLLSSRIFLVLFFLFTHHAK